ncbi:MAG: DUF2512 family protein [Bacillota bacterium]|jgi:hypothetical protein
MDHIRGIAIKSLFNGIPAIAILSTSGQLSLGVAVVVAIMLTVFAYILGDLFVLPRSNNSLATLADIGLAFLILWALRSLGVPLSWAGIIYTTAAVSLVEWLFFHPYLHREVRRDEI